MKMQIFVWNYILTSDSVKFYLGKENFINIEKKTEQTYYYGMLNAFSINKPNQTRWVWGLADVQNRNMIILIQRYFIYFNIDVFY